ncbi:serine/threonine-protein kinase [Skeletonema marinoi]|uniref:Serine/threonine-protein kinase n=1 Tax=Skeletonema marinoi TaxID=267567 RepID=A0AAD8XYU1_9STRA|nr:serine/threonine-protein kinase [Skeletonema marinoi]
MEDPLDWLKKKPSVEDAKAFIKNHPDALMGQDDEKLPLPLHIAIRYYASDEVILLLLEACPQAAALERGYYNYLPLHYAIWEGTRMSSEEVIKALLNAHLGAASERNPHTGNLPLHDAVNMNASEGIILSLLNAYPQAAFVEIKVKAEETKDGRLLFEIYLERKASDDFMREICKVRVDGLLTLGFVLTKRSSVDIVLAVLEAYPEAARKRFSTKSDECILPLHIAYEDKHSEPVKDALRRAYPGAAEKENPFETTHQLHKFLQNKPLDQLDGDDVEDLIKTYPEAAGKRGRDGRLPLHIAIDRIAPPDVTGVLIEAYPQAGKEKMKDGRLPIEVIVTRKVTDDWPQECLTGMAKYLLDYDMPVSIEDGTPVEHSGSWHACISSSTKTATDAVRKVLLDSKKRDDDNYYGGGFGKHIHALAEVHDAKGRTALGLASEESREVILDYLFPSKLHKFLAYAPLEPDGDDVRNLIEMYPEAMGKRGRDGRLPLHIAIDRIASPEVMWMLFDAYPQAGKEKMKDGRLPIEVFVTRKVTDGWSQSDLTDMAILLLDNDMPVSKEDGTPVEHSGSWHACISDSTETATDAVRKVLLDSKKRDDDNYYGGGFGKHIHALAEAHDAKGRTALGLASEESREVILDYLFPSKLHKFLAYAPLEPDGDDVRNLIEMYPEAMGKRGRDGRLPLHIAIDRIASPEVMWMLFDAYPQAGKEKMKDGRLPIEVLATQKVTDGWSQSDLTDMAILLLDNDMPVSKEDGTPVEHSDSWHACISDSTETATDAVRKVLLDSKKRDDDNYYGGGFGKYIHALAEVHDAKGRTALGLASKESREIIYEYLLFCGRYKLQFGPPEYRTKTSVVLRAQDLSEQADYDVIFDNADKDKSGKLDKDELKEISGTIGLDPGMFLRGSGKSTTTISKDEFVVICKQQLGDGPREVVIKLMQSKNDWERECSARKKYELESKYVVSALPKIPPEYAIAKAVRDGEGGLNIIKEKYLDNIAPGIYAIVMNAADRNVLQMLNQEQPKLDSIKAMLRQVFEAVQHMHEKNLMHGDIKMVNIVRFRIDNKLRLIDLDASAEISVAEETFAGAKFSSAILPPEMIERIETDEKLEEFDKYWEAENKDLVTKVSPKPYKKHGVKGHYVVKSFRTGLDGKPVEEGLPYTLVDASRSIDAWSLGVLAFTLLTGESLIPSTRDDDCASGNAMHALYSWGEQPEKEDEVFKKMKDDAARNLVWTLLKPKAEERPTVASLLEKHPFFNPKMSASTEDQFRDMNESLQNISNQVEILNGNILEVKKLSIESKDELLHTRHVLHRTRHVLLKGIFEATEVITPTTFIILNNKLPPAAEPSGEQVEKICGIDAAEDGSGVSVTTKHASLAVSAEGLEIDLKGDLKKYGDQAKTGILWAKRIREISTNFAAGDIDKAFETIKEGIKDLIVGNEMYLYLIDELTGKPVEAKGWPLIITTPSEKVPRLIPLMQVGMRAISICNGAAGFAKVFGIPAPKVPKEWLKGAQDSVELLKQESSVQEFGIVHAQVKGGTQENTSVRGASLREFQDFLKTNDPGQKEGKNGHFAGLQRFGDPEDGTALWTALTDQSAIENALKERANEREEEERKQNLNRRQEEMAELKVATLEETNEETSGTEEVHSLTDEFAKRNDTRNALADSEEIAELIRLAATAAAKEAASAPAAAKDSEEIAELIRLAATAAAKAVVSAPAAGSVCCTIM